MMKLFAEGIKEGEHFVTDQLESSFDFEPEIMQRNLQSGQSNEGLAMGGQGQEIVLMVDGHELARFLAPAMSTQLAFGRG